MAAKNLSHLRLPPLPTVRDLVKLYRIRALRQLSQNFLMDEVITDKIVKAAGNIKNHYVCEVGPGPGGITRSIIKHSPKKLIVVEKDPRFLPTLELLQEACVGQTDIQIEIGDIRDFNMEKGFEEVEKHSWDEGTPPIHLIGNLPFHVSTNLIIRWLKNVSERTSAWSFGRSSMTLTFQKEVGERMIARASEAQRCRLSVMCQFWCDVHYKFTIPGKAFVPKPEVDVAVVTFVPLKQPLVDMPFEVVEKVCRNIFNMRQKYCVRGAERLFPEEVREKLSEELFRRAYIDPTTRPFELSNEEFVSLCHAYRDLSLEYPEVAEYDSRGPKTHINQRTSKTPKQPTRRMPKEILKDLEALGRTVIA